MKEHEQIMIQDTDQRVLVSLKSQEMNAESSRFGGFYDVDEVVQAKYSVYRIVSMMAAYCHPKSIFYQSQKVMNRIMMGLQYVERVQHEDGLFDLVTCNFDSVPDTAFILKKLLPLFQFLSARDCNSEEQNVLDALCTITKKASQGLKECGFHTPNHRWAIASMLLAYGRIFKDEAMRDKAFCFLNEGIDCSEDGEYSEKSAGNYNRINNDAMMTIAEELNDMSYEQYAIKNLEMMMNYLEPDDSIFTDNSTRYDKNLLIYPKDYYFEYLSLGIRYHRSDFVGMANYIFYIIKKHHISSPDMLILYMLHPDWAAFESYEMTDRFVYEKMFQNSKIFRMRNQDVSCTVLAGNASFFVFHYGSMRISARLVGSFFEHRAFVPESIEQYKNQVILKQTMHGWYYLPLDEKQKTSDWWKMDQTKRRKKYGPDMSITVTITFEKNEIVADFKTAGVEGAPWRIEFNTSGVERLYSENELDSNYSDKKYASEPGACVIAPNGDVTLQNGPKKIRLNSCFSEHRYIHNREDGKDQVKTGLRVYCTAYTPFLKQIKLQYAVTKL